MALSIYPMMKSIDLRCP